MFAKPPQPSANQPAPARPSVPMQPATPPPVSDPFAGASGGPRVPRPSKPKIKTTGKMSAVGWVIIVLVIVGVLGVCGVFAYSRFINTPERLFDKALDNLEKLQSGTVDYQIALTGSQKPGTTPSILSLGDQFSLNFGLKTTFSKQADGFYQNQSTVTVDIPTGASLPWFGSLTFSPKVDLVMVEREQFYLKLLGIPFEAFGLPDLNDQWIQISFAALEEEYGLKAGSNQDADRMETVKAAVKRLYRDHRFLVFGKKNTEAVDGVAHYHFAATIDESALKAFLLALDQDPTINEFLTAYGNSASASSSMTPEEIDEALAKLDLDAEFWINAKQKEFKRMKFNVRYDDEEMSSSANTTVTLADYNQPVTIAAPTAYKTLQQIIEEMTAALTPAPTSGVYDDFARCLTDKGAKMYGASWCSHCGNQKELFGSSWQYVTYVECTIADQQDQAVVCQQAGITSYPTWQFGDGSQVTGEMTFEQLSQQTGCLLTTTAEPPTSADSDADGLSDDQEVMYGTDPMNPDSDGDGYLDGAEVQNGYNPAGPGPLTF